MGNNLLLLASIALNVILLTTTGPYLVSHESWRKHEDLSWSQEAAAEAEAVAAISCSSHGRAYVDGSVDHLKPICECSMCYTGEDCASFVPHCNANSDSGDPLFLEPFWMKHAAKSAVLISGWHRMSYSFHEKYTTISPELEIHVRKVHALARNANTKGKYIIFGVGSTQLLGAAVFALSMNLSSPASVVAAVPSYPIYKAQTDFFQNAHFAYQGDAFTLNNSSYETSSIIEFVTSPNNPDGALRKAVSQGSSVSAIHDHAYYWPHFSPIPAPADEDLMIFTMSKLTGHAGSRLGWAIVKDKGVYQRMATYISLAEMGISRDTQLRALKLLKTIVHGNGTEIFEFGYHTMRSRWEKLIQIISLSKRFTLQEIQPQFCNYFEKVREPSPAYAWVRCEREEESDCNAVLRAANILSRPGSLFNFEDRYARLSLLIGEDDFNVLLLRLNELIANEDGAKIM